VYAEVPRPGAKGMTLKEIEDEEGGPVKESMVGMAQVKRAVARKSKRHNQDDETEVDVDVERYEEEEDEDGGAGGGGAAGEAPPGSRQIFDVAICCFCM
jgi:hypothetical protein